MRSPNGSSDSVKVFYPRWTREQLVAEPKERVAGLSEELPLHRVVLFGSWSTGRATAFSDIDLLVVYGGESRPDAYKVVRRAIHLKGLEPHVYSEVEAESLSDILGRMTQTGITIF